MKKVLYILTCTLLFSACENFYLNNQLGFEPTIEDVRNFAYTLTEADYASIASNPTNIATTLAMGKNEKDSSIYTRLQNLKTTKYFADTLIAPELFIPAFMTAKYPHLSEGTICEVTYRITADALRVEPLLVAIILFVPILFIMLILMMIYDRTNSKKR